MSAFGSTLGLGTLGAEKFIAESQAREMDRYRLAQMQRADAEALGQAASTQSVLRALGGLPDVPLTTFTSNLEYPERMQPTAAPAAPTPASVAAPTAPVVAAPTTAAAPGYIPTPAFTFGAGTPASPTGAFIDPKIIQAGEDINKRVALLNAMREKQRAATNTGAISGGVMAPTYSSTVDTTAKPKPKPPEKAGVTPPESKSATEEVITAPVSAAPPPAATTGNYLSNPGIIPNELNRATESRKEMAMIVNALQDSLQYSDKYLTQFLEARAKINQVDSQIFLLAASEGIINLKLGDTRLLSDVISSARGVPYEIVAKPGTDMFDIFVGGQAFRQNVTFDEIERDAKLFVDESYRLAWQASATELDALRAKYALETDAALTVEQFKADVAANQAASKAQTDLLIAGIGIEGKLAELRLTKNDVTAVNGGDGNVYFYTKGGDVYRVDTITTGKGKNAATTSTLVPVEMRAADPTLVFQ